MSAPIQLTMGPVLGEEPGTRFNPRDDRIVSLALHLNLNPKMGYDVDVGMRRPWAATTAPPNAPTPAAPPPQTRDTRPPSPT